MMRPLELVFVEQCAPTLAGQKPANLFRYRAEQPEDVIRAVRRWNRQLNAKGVQVVVLKRCPNTGACLIYAFRPRWLAQLLSDRETRAFLCAEGYAPVWDNGELLAHLSQKLCLQRAFPHEVGVFLGYPLEDVKGFIVHRGQNYTCAGYWKSYGDPAQARATFACYKRCSQVYKQRYESGESLTALVVAA